MAATSRSEQPRMTLWSNLSKVTEDNASSSWWYAWIRPCQKVFGAQTLGGRFCDWGALAACEINPAMSPDCGSGGVCVEMEGLLTLMNLRGLGSDGRRGGGRPCEQHLWTGSRDKNLAVGRCSVPDEGASLCFRTGESSWWEEPIAEWMAPDNDSRKLGVSVWEE